jgi:hypothetical protein
MTYIEAEYEDGYIHSEQAYKDISPYNGTSNIFNDILEKRPEADHGPLVRFSLYHGDHKYSVNWRGLPDNARPIRYKHMRLERNMATGEQHTYMDGVDFGYQYTDDAGTNQQEIVNL